jgi:hypothetical protein
MNYVRCSHIGVPSTFTSLAGVEAVCLTSLIEAWEEIYTIGHGRGERPIEKPRTILEAMLRHKDLAST